MPSHLCFLPQRSSSSAQEKNRQMSRARLVRSAIKVSSVSSSYCYIDRGAGYVIWTCRIDWRAARFTVNIPDLKCKRSLTLFVRSATTGLELYMLRIFWKANGMRSGWYLKAICEHCRRRHPWSIQSQNSELVATPRRRLVGIHTRSGRSYLIHRLGFTWRIKLQPVNWSGSLCSALTTRTRKASYIGTPPLLQGNTGVNST